MGKKNERKDREDLAGSACVICGCLISNDATRCKSCSKTRKRKFDPTPEELQELLWKYSMREISKIFGISDKAVDKRRKLYGLEKPPTGFWAKKENLPK